MRDEPNRDLHRLFDAVPEPERTILLSCLASGAGEIIARLFDEVVETHRANMSRIDPLAGDDRALVFLISAYQTEIRAAETIAESFRDFVNSTKISAESE